MSFGIIMLDANARPVVINRAAHEILVRDDGLVLHGDVLSAATAQETSELRRRIQQALAICRGELPPLTSAEFVISRPSLKRPLHALITPLRIGSSTLTLHAAAPIAAIFVSDPENEPATPASMLRTFYGFTPAETRLLWSFSMTAR